MREGILAIWMLAFALPVPCVDASVHIDLPGDYDGWTPTSVELAPGDTLSITATGCICYGPPCPGEMETDPDGRYCWDPSQSPGLPGGGWTCEAGIQLGLVGKIGDSPCFTVGSAFSAVVSTAGQLFLAYNDRTGGFANNFGSFSIEVSRSIPPPTGACCFPTTYCLQLTEADCVGAGGTYMGDGVTCDTDPCSGTPVKSPTWGEVKSRFR
jgi:hypothetical protein